MREIKFRAWDKFNACYWHSEKYKSLADFFQIMQSLNNGGNEIVYEQYAGLKDKNGKDIYDGDILHSLNFNNNAPVIFSEGCFGRDLGSGVVSVIPIGRDYKIIGNIYENPELLQP